MSIARTIGELYHMIFKTLQLTARARQHDADAFTQLIDIYKKDLYTTAVAILHGDNDAADAIQDAILTSWEKIPTLQQDRYFKTWLIRILINKCYDILDQRMDCSDIELCPEEEAPDDYNLELKEALSVLDERYRLPVVMFYWQGYSAKEIAGILGIPIETVRTRIKRGRARLADWYDDERKENDDE